MSYYANQKTITINKPQFKKDDIKVLIKRDTLEAAARNLTGTEFKLYMYFASNSDGYKVEFAPKFFKRDYGVGEDTARKAMKSLEEKGYLVLKNGYECLFDFYLEPQEEPDFIEERKLVTLGGKEKAFTFDEFKEMLSNKKYDLQVILNYWNNPAYAKPMEEN